MHIRAIPVLLLSTTAWLGCPFKTSTVPKPTAGQKYVAPASTLTFEELHMLRHLLLSENYEILDARLNAIQERYEQDRTKEFDTYLGYSMFYAADPSLAPFLEEWTHQMPNSYSAHAARGHYYARQGWLSRGIRIISQTSEEQLSKMSEAFEIARAELEAAIAINPRLIMAYSELIDIGSGIGDRKLMDESLDSATRIDPYAFAPRSSYMDALFPMWGGSRSEMLSFAQAAQVHAQGNPKLETLFGYVHLEDARHALMDGDFERAMELYDEALRFGENLAFVRAKAQLLYHLKRYPEAIALCDRILEVSPTSVFAFQLRGASLYAHGSRDEGFRDFARALSLDPGDPETLKLHDSARTELDELESGLRALDASLAADPDNAGLLAERGKLLLENAGSDQEIGAILKRAVELDERNAEAWYYLGLWYAKNGDPRAESSLQRGLELSSGSELYVDLAHKYREGSMVPQDMALASKWYLEAAERGDVVSQRIIGWHYLFAVGVPEDYAEALRWLRVAAQEGDAHAMGHLGFMYDMGYGVSRDYLEAATWYRRSAENGFVHGRYNLALLYWDGRGLKRDLVTAYLLIATAAAEGDEDAQKRLPELMWDMTPSELQEAQRRLDAGETGLEGRRPTRRQAGGY